VASARVTSREVPGSSTFVPRADRDILPLLLALWIKLEADAYSVVLRGRFETLVTVLNASVLPVAVWLIYIGESEGGRDLPLDAPEVARPKPAPPSEA
jgi:hypothetical protein